MKYENKEKVANILEHIAALQKEIDIKCNPKELTKVILEFNKGHLYELSFHPDEIPPSIKDGIEAYLANRKQQLEKRIAELKKELETL